MISEDFLENMSAGDISNSHLHIHTMILEKTCHSAGGGKKKQQFKCWPEYSVFGLLVPMHVGQMIDLSESFMITYDSSKCSGRMYNFKYRV